MVYKKDNYELYEEHWFDDWEDKWYYGYTLYKDGKEICHAGRCTGVVTIDEWIVSMEKIKRGD